MNLLAVYLFLFLVTAKKGTSLQAVFLFLLARCFRLSVNAQEEFTLLFLSPYNARSLADFCLFFFLSNNSTMLAIIQAPWPSSST